VSFASIRKNTKEIKSERERTSSLPLGEGSLFAPNIEKEWLGFNNKNRSFPRVWERELP